MRLEEKYIITIIKDSSHADLEKKNTPKNNIWYRIELK